MHVAVHYPALAEEYGLPVNMSVLVGEDKHRAFKKWIYTTNHRQPEKDLLTKEKQRQTLRLLLADAFKITEPTATQLIKDICQECPQLFSTLLPRSEQMELSGSLVDYADEADEEQVQADRAHPLPLVTGCIQPSYVRAHRDRQPRAPGPTPDLARHPCPASKRWWRQTYLEVMQDCHVTSDRGPQFVSDFWQELFAALHMKQRLSSSYHPQTDGQSERANQSLEQYLRAFINYAQDDRLDWLPIAEFSLNNQVSDSTGIRRRHRGIRPNRRFSFQVPGEAPPGRSRAPVYGTHELDAKDKDTAMHVEEESVEDALAHELEANVSFASATSPSRATRALFVES